MRETGMRHGNRFATALVVSILALLWVAAGASAAELRHYGFADSIDGSGSAAGAFSPNAIDITIDQSSGHLLALDQDENHTYVSQFDLDGNPVAFSALGTSSIVLPGGPSFEQRGAIQFDNTGNDIGFVVLSSYRPLSRFAADGSLVWEKAGAYQGADVAIGPDGIIYVPGFNGVHRFEPADGRAINGEMLYEMGVGKLEVDSTGHYLTQKSREPGLDKTVPRPECAYAPFTGDICRVIDTLTFAEVTNLTVDLANDHVYAIEEGKRVTEYGPGGEPITTFGAAEGLYGGLENARGIAVDSATHDVYVLNMKGGAHVDVFHQKPPVTVPTVTTEPPQHPEETTAVLTGTVDPAGIDTTDCKIEWGSNFHYANGSVPCDQGDVLSGTDPIQVTATVESLTPGATYHYRVVARNANGYWSYGAEQAFEASVAPTSPAVLVDRVNTDGARFTATIDPHGGYTSYHFEIGTGDCAAEECTRVPSTDLKLKSNLDLAQVQQSLSGLQPNTHYFVTLVAQNAAGTTRLTSEFHTQPSPPTSDPCPNATLRQATGAYLLADCRAYELVTAANAGGYGVESDLVPGQTPFAAYPSAPDRLLYGLHFGSLPGVDGPTNYGLDPYVAERGAAGWASRYVGIPSGEMADSDAYGSPLLGADRLLETFAFGGEGICDPCFAGGGTNIPVRYKGGPPIPGIPGEADPAGLVREYLSADGTHLVFGATTQLAAGGVEGALTLYERELPGGPVQTISTDETGATFSGPGTAALAVSADGSRVVVGDLVSSAAGVDRYHLYMHVGSAGASADLTPGATTGAIFAGMTEDGSKVFLTTSDRLAPADTDDSADIYEVDVAPDGTASAPQLISVRSTGAPSNDDSCAAVGSPRTWNAAAGDGMCGAVAFAGGAGVAAGDGTFYFVSPEQLEAGKGVAGEVNLYVVEPGAAPRFVVTMDDSATKAPPPPPQHPLEDASFASLPGPEALTLDPSNGDVYVIRGEEGIVTRLDSSGDPKNFTAGPGAGTNSISGFGFDAPSGASVAVDGASGSPFQGDFYVSAHTGPYAGVTVWSPSGEKLGKLTGSATANSSFTDVCGVAVDQTDGTVYVAERTGYIWKYVPTGSAPVTDADYAVTGLRTPGMSPCAIAADGDGHLYASEMSDGPVKRYLTKGFIAGNPLGQSGLLIDQVGKAIAVDPVSLDVYVDEGNQISIFGPDGESLGQVASNGVFSGSRGIAVDATQHLYVAAGVQAKIAKYGSTPSPYDPIDNPAVLHAVQQPSVRSSGDFQVSPDGEYAAFATSQPIGSYKNLGHYEIYRYATAGHELECASCNPTLAPAKADTTLTGYGLNLADDGRVFFTSTEGLVLADTNEKEDVFEWTGGSSVWSISTGTSLSDSRLLSASSDGKDVFFFTHDVLVPSDENGGAMKVYDAREGGGFPHELRRLPCAASDECHGPGTPIPDAPNINSIAGAEMPPPATAPKRCKKGFAKRHGKCVKKKKPRHRRHHHRKAGKRHG